MQAVTSTLKVQVAHSFNSLTEEGRTSQGSITREEWDSLLHRSASNVVFLTWQWQTLWWRHFGSEGECRLHLLSVRAEGGALVGIAPLFIASAPMPPIQEYERGVPRPEGEGEPVRTVRIVGGIDIADYLDIIAPADKLQDVWAAVLDYLMERREEWDAIDFHSLPPFSPSHNMLSELAEERDLISRVFPEDVCPVTELPGDWETYLMSLRKKDRHELRRKVRKLEGRDDAHWYLVLPTDEEAMSRNMETFLELHRKSGSDKARFMDEKMAAFFMESVTALAHTGWLDLAILEMAGEPASAYLSFLYGGRLYLYNSGYDPKFASYSAGVALLAYRIHKAILQGVKTFDFLRGDEPYKYDFGAKDTYVYRALLKPREQAQRLLTEK